MCCRKFAIERRWADAIVGVNGFQMLSHAAAVEERDGMSRLTIDDRMSSDSSHAFIGFR